MIKNKILNTCLKEDIFDVRFKGCLHIEYVKKTPGFMGSLH